MTATALKTETHEDLEADVDEAIRQAGGQREAIRGSILGQREITEQLASAISADYVRRRLKRIVDGQT